MEFSNPISESTTWFRPYFEQNKLEMTALFRFKTAFQDNIFGESQFSSYSEFP